MRANDEKGSRRSRGRPRLRHPGRAGQRQPESQAPIPQRLTELLDARLVYQLPDRGYALTPLGQRAYQALLPLIKWSGEWAEKLRKPGR